MPNRMRRLAIGEKAKKKVRSRVGRRDLLNRCGEKAFLDPANLRFPIVIPGSSDCTPECKMIHAAYNRAREYGYNEIAGKAEALYKANNCEEKLKIKIHD